MPFLVFYERKFYCFEGLLYDKEIRYKKVYFPGPDPRKDTYGKRLRKADKLRLEGRRIVLFKKNRVVDILEATNNLFAPEHPFLIKFS